MTPRKALPIGMVESPRAPRFLLRIPDGLRAHLGDVAAANRRTLTAEILARLEASTEGESIDEHGVIVRVLKRRQTAGEVAV